MNRIDRKKSLNHSVLVLCMAILLAFAGDLWECRAIQAMNVGSDGSCEKIYVHLDKTVYVAGENIQYKVYIINGNKPLQPPESKILYFSLAGFRENLTIQWRINLKNNTAEGSCRIPENAVEGVYMLKAYTNRMRNNSSECQFSQKIFVLNLARETSDSIFLPETQVLPEMDTVITDQDAGMNVSGNKPGIQISALQPSYGPGEKVRMEISLGQMSYGDTANLSVSVTEASPFSVIFSNTDIQQQFNHSALLNSTKCTYGVEDKGYILNGKVKNRLDNSPIAGGRIILGIVDSVQGHLLYASSNSQGDFCFYLDKGFDNREIILQLADQPRNSEVTWELDNKRITPAQGSYMPYVLRPEQKAFLNSTKDIWLVGAIYNPLPDTVQPVPISYSSNYSSKPDLVVYPSDYAELVNFKEIDDNILPSTRFIERNGERIIQVFDLWSGDWYANSTVLLNNIPFTDMNYIGVLGTNDIQRIEVFYASYLIGGLTFSGLVSVYTKDHKIPAPYLKNRAYVYQNTVIPTNDRRLKKSAVPIRLDDHFPDFRTSLCWEPEIKVTGNGTLVIDFTTSQLTGSYIINVQGISSDGSPLSSTASFEVK
jgi:hypothetical protein